MSKRDGRSIFLRLSTEERKLLDAAAALGDQAVSTWCRSTVLRRARRLLDAAARADVLPSFAVPAVKGRPTNG